MTRLARRLQHHKRASQPTFDAQQHYLEAALRGRTARKVRAHLRRMDPVVLTTPRWSEPQTFLEDIALDLAVGEPTVGCRTLSLKPLKGRGSTDAWSFMLATFSQLVPGGDSLRSVAGRKGFRVLGYDLLMRAQERVKHPVALLAHGAEFLPIDVIEDLGSMWARFAETSRSDRRATMLIAGTVDTSRVNLEGGSSVALLDYGEAEAAAAIVGRAGAAPRQNLEAAARFTGGIPAVVDAVGKGARQTGGVPRSRAGLVRAMGPLADEIRYAVDIVNMQDELADRLDELMMGEPLVEVPTVDKPLMLAGLLRRVRLPGEDRVMLRAPAIGAIIG